MLFQEAVKKYYDTQIREDKWSSKTLRNSTRSYMSTCPSPQREVEDGHGRPRNTIAVGEQFLDLTNDCDSEYVVEGGEW